MQRSTSDGAEWFIPAHEGFDSERVALHLRLNRATRWYRELVVPGIGGAWFVRQLSWAVAGLALAEQTNSRHSPTRVANGIEALACKLAWQEDPDTAGIRGKRAFGRPASQDVWSFEELSQPKYYVRVTFRQSAVGALVGLGLAEGGTMFHSMGLTKAGRDLAESFLTNDGASPRFRASLRGWLRGEGPRPGPLGALARESPSGGEKRLVRERLEAESAGAVKNGRRSSLVRAFGKTPPAECPDTNGLMEKLGAGQRCEVRGALSFDGMVAAGRSVLKKSASLLEKTGQNVVHVRELASAKGVRGAVDSARQRASAFADAKGDSGEGHPDAIEYAQAVGRASSREAAVMELIRRDGSVLVLSDNRVSRGPLFHCHAEAEEETTADVGTEESSTENKIRQLFALWKDCMGKD